MCQARVTLAAAGAGTRVRYVEQYSDESAAADRDATAKKTTADLQSALAALKRNAER